MATSHEEIAAIFDRADIKYESSDDPRILRTVWLHEAHRVALLVIILEDGELVQLRTPNLLRADDDASKPLLFRAMLQMAYDTRLVQFEYDPRDGEVCTCIDIALEDNTLSDEQLLRCCSILLDVSSSARERLTTILETGKDPALENADVDEEEAKQRQSQLDEMVEVARLLRATSKGGDA
jgi:hypothetical protein